MRTYEVSVESAFSASHSLLLPDGTPEDSHPHTWQVTATFRSGELDEAMGVVIDFVAVQAAMADVAGPLDGTDLNSQPQFADGRASAERVAELVASRLGETLAGQLHAPGNEGPWLYRVSITEAPGCVAAFYPFGS